MAYIGNTAEQQAFTPAIDYFNGNGSTVAFTLSRPVASVAQVQAVIENVPQNPGDAFTVSGNTITFTSAPPSGTSNIYVYYTSPITQVIQPGQGTVGLTQLTATGTPSASNYLRGDNSWAAVASSQWTTTGSDIYYNTGNVGIGTSSPAQKLDVASKVQIDTSNSFGKIKIARATDSGVSALYIQGADNAGTANELSLVNAGGSGAAINIAGGDVKFYTASNTTERMRIDSSGNVGIGTSSPSVKLHVVGGQSYVTGALGSGAYSRWYNNAQTSSDFQVGQGWSSASDNVAVLNNNANAAMIFGTNGTERMRIDSSGNLLFNSGYGSVATAYGCRAWVSFAANGGISASGNISSVSDNGTGDYTVNFSTAMPDGNYAVVAMSRVQEANICSTCLYNNSTPSTSSFRLSTGVVGNAFQDLPTRVAVFR